MLLVSSAASGTILEACSQCFNIDLEDIFLCKICLSVTLVSLLESLHKNVRILEFFADFINTTGGTSSMLKLFSTSGGFKHLICDIVLG